MIFLSREQGRRLRRRFDKLYGREVAPRLMERFLMMLGRYGVGEGPQEKRELWNEKDVVLITYADSLRSPGAPPLATLRSFLCEHAKGAIETVHLLPFYPWSSDDGFSVIDYREVARENGSWDDVEKLGEEFDLMFDFVLNHCSRKSAWFREFVIGVEPGKGYFVTADPEEDLSAVVRPRTSPLLTKTATRNGDAWVWTTFSADQVDLDWTNPDLLFEFLDILFLYLSKGSRIYRLDAVAFLWKTIGTDCLHLPETHEVVKLFRDVLEIVAPSSILLTETNVPHEENISYFGKGDEAHMVYNFSLPPLLLYSYLKGDATLLTSWALGLPPLGKSQCFFNFTASHDGVGVRPLQGLVDDSEIAWLAGEVRARGGRVSSRSLPDGSEAPYELNISYREALRIDGDTATSRRRFLASQALMLAMPGMPAVYIHSLLGTPNDLEGLEKLGYNRAINRKKWDREKLEDELGNPGSEQAAIFSEFLRMLRTRREQSAFHPGAGCRFLDLSPHVFAFTRTCPKSRQTILCLFNLTGGEVSVTYTASDGAADIATDLLTGRKVPCDPELDCPLPAYDFVWLRLY